MYLTYFSLAMLRGAVSEFLYHQYDYFRKTKYTIIISFSYIFFLLSFFLFGHKNS